MAPFPWLNFFCMFFSLWAATTPRLRSSDVKLNWWIFYGNLVPAGFNAAFVVYWIIEWVAA